MGQKMYFYQSYKLRWKSLKNPISVCKWEIAPFRLQSILGFVPYFCQFESCNKDLTIFCLTIKTQRQTFFSALLFLLTLIDQTHSELKWEIRLGNYFWGCNAQIFYFCLPLDFLGVKDFKKLQMVDEGRKGQIKGQTLENSSFDHFFMSI